jgi:hypothetical protein
MTTLQLEVLPARQRQLLDRLAADPWIAAFYLAGGTGLALQLGHRQSVDFDFFAPAPVSAAAVVEQCRQWGTFALESQSRHTVHGTVACVRVSFISYWEQLLDPVVPFGQVRLAAPRDIACMKLDAIASRGSKKDFVDLHFLLRAYSLADLLRAYQERTQGQGLPAYQLLKALVYFADADPDPLPAMRQPVDWDAVKRDLARQVAPHRRW